MEALVKMPKFFDFQILLLLGKLNPVFDKFSS